jgi:putative nucleotidyltransferase with HDIG domain
MLLALDSNLAKLLERETSSNEKLAAHCINTALIAMDLAKEISKNEFTAQEIGAAALLHDIGVIALGLDFEIDEKSPDYTKHVAKGLELLEEMKVPESIKIMVSQHHERLDGHGYPKKIAGKDFLISSQILALAETFERIMADSLSENGSAESPQQNYVQATLDNFHKALDPEILKTFISIRGFYPNGIMVELNNRSIGLILKQNEGFPLRPVVQVVLDSAGNHPDAARIIDLRSINTLSIIRAITYGEQK